MKRKILNVTLAIIVFGYGLAISTKRTESIDILYITVMLKSVECGQMKYSPCDLVVRAEYFKFARFVLCIDICLFVVS